VSFFFVGFGVVRHWK